MPNFRPIVLAASLAALSTALTGPAARADLKVVQNTSINSPQLKAYMDTMTPQQRAQMAHSNNPLLRGGPQQTVIFVRGTQTRADVGTMTYLVNSATHQTYTTSLTDEFSKKNNKKRAEYLIENDTLFNVGQYSFETYYPGQGHTADNIVIWFDKEKILYGGCLIKGADAENLGYLGDGNVIEYYSTLKKVQQKCPTPKFIIISHSEWDNINSLKHSIKLAKKLKRQNYR